MSLICKYNTAGSTHDGCRDTQEGLSYSVEGMVQWMNGGGSDDNTSTFQLDAL